MNQSTLMLRNAILLHAVVLVALVLSSAAGAQESTLTLRLHEGFIDRVASAALPHTESRRYQGTVNLGLTQQPWALDTRFTVQSLKTKVTAQHVAVDARVRVQTTGVDYTSSAHGVLRPRLEGNKLILVATGLELPLRAAPFGVEIQLGTIPADDFLPERLRTFSIDLSALAVPIELPNDRVVSVRVSGLRLEFEPPSVLVHAALGI